MTSLSEKTKDCECTADNFVDDCKECCEHHFDPGEGFMCDFCGEQGDPADYYGSYSEYDQ